MNSLEKEFVPYEEALELKELGFDEPCFAFYEKNKELIIQECEITDFHFDCLQCMGPTFSQAFRWFRERYGLFSSFVEYSEEETFEGYYMYHITRGYNEDGFITCEEAELACLKKLIEIVKNTTKL